MQVKKFEAPTIQEALDTIKRELGPEAIILQTKKYKRGFGLMSKASVEVTAAVSERSLQKKNFAESRIPDQARSAVKKMPAGRQAEFYDKYAEKTGSQPVDDHLRKAAGAARDRVEVGSRGTGQAGKRITATRYIDIDADQAPRPAAAKGPAPRQGVMGMEVGPIAGMSVEEELRHLKRMIEEMKVAQDAQSLGGSGAPALLSKDTVPGGEQGVLGTPALQDALEQLVINGMDKRHAFQLIKEASFELGPDRSRNPDDVLDQLAAEIMRHTEIRAPLASVRPLAEPLVPAQPDAPPSRPAMIALVGPTGVGKTTTVAKLASEALLKRNLRVGLINLDSYKIAAFDHLGTYAKILNVPFRPVATAEELAAAIQDFRSLDLILIDTTGRSQRDPASLGDLRALVKTVPEIRSQLVLSVTTRDAELYDMANRFAIFRPEGIIVSKLDEATIYGSIYNLCQRAKLPLLYFTTGQRVPEDIEEATRERVASLILEI